MYDYSDPAKTDLEKEMDAPVVKGFVIEGLSVGEISQQERLSFTDVARLLGQSAARMETEDGTEKKETW